jgi:MFS family permease
MVLPLVCIAFWTPTAYERLYGVPSPTAGMWMGIGYILFGITGTLGGGWLADRWDRKGRVDGKLRVLLVAALGLGPFAVAGQFMPTMWSALPCLWAAMFFAGMGLGPISAAVQVMTPTALRARAAAVLYLIVNLVAFAGIPLAGQSPTTSSATRTASTCHWPPSPWCSKRWLSRWSYGACRTFASN